MIPKIRETEDLRELINEFNRRIEIIDREFALKSEIRVKINEVKSLSGRPPRDMQEEEIRYRDNQGTMQFILRKNGRLHSCSLDTETI